MINIEKDNPDQDINSSDVTFSRRIGGRLASCQKQDRPEDRKQNLIKILPLLPLLIAVGIVPLVVFLKVVPVPPRYQQFWVTSIVFDFFSFYKAQIILVCAAVILIAAFVLAWFGKLPRKMSALYIPLAVYAVMLIASSLKSAHPSIALDGFFDRDEGMWVLLAYVVLLVGAYLFVSEVRQIWLILAVWAAALCVISVLGIFQFFGLDFFQSLAGRLLILPVKYQYIAPVLDFNFPRYSIYATLYNPNNVASMLTLAFPLATTFFVLSRSRRCQVAFGLLAGLLCLTLLGSNGRSGWIAVLLALALLVALSILRGVTGWWKRLAILALVAVIGYGTFNFVSSGNLGKRAGEPMTDVKKVLENGTSQGVAGESLTQPGTQEGLAEQLIRKYGLMASGRGYIWIRSLQMAGDTILLGRGPDTFALYFPNTDPYKAFYSQPEVFIDKPHNLYLQLWLNLGGLATLAFLVMVIMHCVSTFKILKQADLADERTMLALGLFLGWLAYLVAAAFYDSAVSVAPAFWVVFGLSMAMNEMLARKNAH